MKYDDQGKSCWIFIINIPDNENSKDFAVKVVKVGLDCIEKAGRQKNNFKKIWQAIERKKIQKMF